MTHLKIKKETGMDYEIAHKLKAETEHICEDCGSIAKDNAEYYRVEIKRDRRFYNIILCKSCYAARKEAKKYHPPAGTNG